MVKGPAQKERLRNRNSTYFRVWHRYCTALPHTCLEWQTNNKERLGLRCWPCYLCTMEHTCSIVSALAPTLLPKELACRQSTVRPMLKSAERLMTAFKMSLYLHVIKFLQLSRKKGSNFPFADYRDSKNMQGPERNLPRLSSVDTRSNGTALLTRSLAPIPT